MARTEQNSVAQVDHIGVHTSHCCARHGCKYGDADCPVVLGTQEQEYPCEENGRDRCDTIAEIPIELTVNAPTRAINEALNKAFGWSGDPSVEPPTGLREAAYVAHAGRVIGAKIMLYRDGEWSVRLLKPKRKRG